MLRRSFRSRSPRRRRQSSRSPNRRRRRSEHDDRSRERGDRGDAPRRRSSHHQDRREERQSQNAREPERARGEGRGGEGGGEKGQEAWQAGVHPSRLMDLTSHSGAKETSANRTDRFATERFSREEQRRDFGRGERERMQGRGRRGGSRWERRSEGDTRGWTEDRGGEGGERREERGPPEEAMEHDEEGRPRRGGRMEGRRGRGRGNWKSAREQEAMEREERVSREKRLLDSLTDPRDVPKGSSYFEHDDRESTQTSSQQSSRRYSTGDERYRRDRRGQRRDEDRGTRRRRQSWRERDRGEEDRGRDRGGGGRERDGGGDRARERIPRQRSPLMWKHDMFEKLQQEEEEEEVEGEGEWEEQDGWEEGNQEMGNGNHQRRSVVNRPGSRVDPFSSGADGVWAHDKFLEHDKLIAYPIQQPQQQRPAEKEREGPAEINSDEVKTQGTTTSIESHQAEVSMETM